MTRKPPGPKVHFSKALCERICTEIAGGKSLTKVCKRTGMPDKGTFLGWVAKHEEIEVAYRAAIQAREEVYFEQVIEIADEGLDPAKTRVQVDARKWALARMNPKKYGDRFTSELTGAEGGPLVVKIVRHGDPDENA